MFCCLLFVASLRYMREGPLDFLKFKDDRKEATKKTKEHKFTRFSELNALNYLLINVTCIAFTFYL